MKKLRAGFIYLLFILIPVADSCNKTATSANATMSATIGGSNITFTTTLANSSGAIVLQGASNRYTVTLYIKSIGASVFTLGDPSTGYYATVLDAFGPSYSTDAVNNGQLSLTESGLTYNGTFYFTANETNPVQGGGNVVVSNGACANL
jgi:hypothetical protein